MKLRIKGNSLRFRVTRSEVSRLLSEGRIYEVIYFTAEEHSRLTYALERSDAVSIPQLVARPQEIAMVLPNLLAASWAEGPDIGIYHTADRGLRGSLDLIVEKDFACLDLSDAENVDTFPNPNAEAFC